jgi:hypothetical protein
MSAPERERSAVRATVDTQPFESAYPPEASLAALEGIMRAHQWVRGRKTVVLFTSSAFSIRRKEFYAEETKTVRALAQSGFSIWGVDVPAGWSPSSKMSDLLTMLAKESGGGFAKGPANVFTRAHESSSCYYAFALPLSDPLDRHQEYALTVSLDTAQYPKLFGLNVLAPSKAIAWSRAELDQARRVAALLNPDDFATPPVTVQLGFPVHQQGKQLLPTRVRVPLSRLTWLPQADGTYQATVSLDAAIHQDTGMSIAPVCQVGAEKTGKITLSLPAPPVQDDRVGLAIELRCEAKSDGLHTARAVINDLLGDQSGAGRSTIYFNRQGATAWQASAVRLMASSGLDYVWWPGQAGAKRDANRIAGRLIDEKHTADPGDKLMLEYVLCGPEKQAALGRMQHVVYATSSAGTRRIEQMLPVSAVSLDSGGVESGTFCAQARVTIPDNSLEAGQYEVMVVEKGADVQQPDPESVLASVPFKVAGR